MNQGTPSLLGFNLEQTFFGFKPTDRITLHDNLFDLLWYGEGRWTWDDVYHMPIFLRRFWVKKLNKIFEDRAAAQEQRAAQQKSNTTRKNAKR